MYPSRRSAVISATWRMSWACSCSNAQSNRSTSLTRDRCLSKKPEKYWNEPMKHCEMCAPLCRPGETELHVGYTRHLRQENNGSSLHRCRAKPRHPKPPMTAPVVRTTQAPIAMHTPILWLENVVSRAFARLLHA